MSNIFVPMKIVRVSCNYVYMTPTKRRNLWDITFQNTSDRPAKYIILEANSYLPILEIRDSQNRKLTVIPRHKLPSLIPKNEYIMLIELIDPIEVGAFGNIYIKAISTKERGEKIPYEKGLIGYSHYPFSPEISPSLDEECSWYVGVFAPKGYVLRVGVGGEQRHEDIFEDEGSYVFRTFSKEPPKFSWDIKIPWRVTSWLITGLIFSFLAPVFSLLIYIYVENLTITFSIMLATIAAIIAMRAWLFYSVELLNRANKGYFIAFMWNLFILGISLFHCTGLWDNLLKMIYYQPN